MTMPLRKATEEGREREGGLASEGPDVTRGSQELGAGLEEEGKEDEDEDEDGVAAGNRVGDESDGRL